MMVPFPISITSTLLEILHEEVEDPEEESFLLFSQDNPSQDLGFVDSKATTITVSVAGRDLTIQQSPTLLFSNNEGGTTGAVIWKITPLFADWIASPSNFLFQASVLGSDSLVLELGCGISGIVGLALAPRISRYVATDQEYVFRLLKKNLEVNPLKTNPSKKPSKSQRKSRKGHASSPSVSNIELLALDWESSSLSTLSEILRLGTSAESTSIDAVVACDCIYNEALIQPFIQTCADLCRPSSNSSPLKPTLCIIAQQLRSHTVFDAWLSAFHKEFRVWRVPDGLLLDGLGDRSGFVIHIGVLR